MGNQPTKQRIGNKTMAINHLQNNAGKDVCEKDTEMRRFVMEMKEAREQMNDNNETKFFNRFNLGEDSTRTSVNADQLLNVKYCPLCNETMKEYEEAPCRVCWRVYHEKCIRNHPNVHNADRIALFKAKTKIGWSCYKCSDLSKLLSTTERANLLEQFQKCDINKDKLVTFDEYLKFKYHMADEEGVELYPEDDHVFRMIFRHMDLDGDGTLDGWEFINHEAKMVLAKREKERLVSYLTEKEIQRARLLFEAHQGRGRGLPNELAVLIKLKSMIGKKAKMMRSRKNTAVSAVADVEDEEEDEEDEDAYMKDEEEIEEVKEENKELNKEEKVEIKDVNAKIDHE
ncbi:hypothetical protein ACJMK2_041633 [Sinanodonta woodiana]|uniref:EF-hand domain-containing protein n=1 Tax=Sinanodonta woodiana TaxID=1069815 RepID=A0ABD3W4R1_SINWO